jgi:hypothetical protein
MTKQTKAPIADLLGQIRPPEKTVSICLAGDLAAEFEDLERDLALAQEQPADGTLAGGANPLATEIAQQIMALRERMREFTQVFRFRGLPRKAYSDLVAQYPPTDEQVAKGDGVDVEAFSAGLVSACCISHSMTEEEAGQLADALTQAQWSALVEAAHAVNAQALDVPFSYRASAQLQSSRRNSK